MKKCFGWSSKKGGNVGERHRWSGDMNGPAWGKGHCIWCHRDLQQLLEKPVSRHTKCARSEAPAPEWPRPQLAKNDPNHDLVPTLRMMDGLMFNRAADEIERWRDAYWSVVSVPAKKLTVVGMGLHHNYTITTQPTCIDGQLIVHTDDPSLTAGAERSEEPAPEGKKE